MLTGPLRDGGRRLAIHRGGGPPFPPPPPACGLEQHQAKELWDLPPPIASPFKDATLNKAHAQRLETPADRPGVHRPSGGQGAPGTFTPAPPSTDAHAVATHPAGVHARQDNRWHCLQGLRVQVARPRRRDLLLARSANGRLEWKGCRWITLKEHRRRSGRRSPSWIETLQALIPPQERGRTKQTWRRDGGWAELAPENRKPIIKRNRQSPPQLRAAGQWLPGHRRSRAHCPPRPRPASRAAVFCRGGPGWASKCSNTWQHLSPREAVVSHAAPTPVPGTDFGPEQRLAPDSIRFAGQGPGAGVVAHGHRSSRYEVAGQAHWCPPANHGAQQARGGQIQPGTAGRLVFSNPNPLSGSGLLRLPGAQLDVMSPT